MVAGHQHLRFIDYAAQIKAMKAFRFIIVDNSRLLFQDSEKVVKKFIYSRLKNAGAVEIRYVTNRDSISSLVNLMLDYAKGDYFVITDIMNPITDYQLVQEMAECMERNDADVCLCEGAIPGTQVEMVIATNRIESFPAIFDISSLRLVRKRWYSQEHFNNQFNLYKFKRLKIFLCLTENLEGMQDMSVNEFVNALNREDIFYKLAAYGENVRLLWHQLCPHCEGVLIPLKLRMSQPFCGYLPSERPIYHECERCGLVLASPYVHEDDVAKIYDIFDKQDFVVTTNNPYQANSTRCDFNLFLHLLPNTVRTLDLGGGMGRFSQFLKETYPNWIVTHSDHEIKQNSQLQTEGIITRSLNFLAKSIGDECYDLITAWEVVEHIPYHLFATALENIHRALSLGGFFVFSTPDFDSPLCRSFDFFGLCPPFHYLVFSESWLGSYFKDSNEWDLYAFRSCSDFLDDAIMWYDYGTKTCPSFQLQATASTLGTIFGFDKSGELRRSILQQGIGTEIIVTLRKR